MAGPTKQRGGKQGGARWRTVAGLAVSIGGLLACAGSGKDAARPGAVHRDTRIVHEACDVAAADARRVDANGDGKSDITVVFEAGRPRCRALDLNFDGIIDSWVYMDAQGHVRRRENDYDRDGRIDEIAIYAENSLQQKQRATTQAGKLDTWHFFTAGKLARTERDSDLDNVVDQWWEYTRADRLDCPVIHSDVDHDGRPDPGATVDACGEGSGYVPPERTRDTAPGASFEPDKAALPQEVEELPSGAAPAEGAPAEAPPVGGQP